MHHGSFAASGTSTPRGLATIPDLLGYAHRVFDEDFDDDGIVVEDRQSGGEYLAGFDIDYSDIPQRSQLRPIVDSVSTSAAWW